ncbi:MAG: hypothetical protein AYK18_09900 [Theionarchaea archaeon DG-70]|nr:MAG: hypothetical protein AYK18_09900 [Theionarchaea archaeon DG-70]
MPAAPLLYSVLFLTVTPNARSTSIPFPFSPGIPPITLSCTVFPEITLSIPAQFPTKMPEPA